MDFGGLPWYQLKGKHFLVYYALPDHKNAAKRTLRRAEEYYRNIGDMIGFTRYGDYWTWDQRAKIFIFPDQEQFLKYTGAPAWSLGYADRDSYMFRSRAIVTYLQEQGFFDGLLPHEIAHLILHDYMPDTRPPVWFDEGIAQLNEAGKVQRSQAMMEALVPRGQFVSLRLLNRWDIREETDPQKVELFYAQSLSVIRFLRDRYGRNAFHDFCRQVRDGYQMDDALRRAYKGRVDSLDDLQEKWVEGLYNKNR